MSLLDQLSSLCIPSSSTNYQPSFLSFNLDPSTSYLSSLSLNQSSSAQKPDSTSETKKSQIHNSQQKMIKLFDDQQLKPTWRLIKTDKKSNPLQKIQSLQQKNLSQFTIDKPQKDNQAIFTQFTKIFYIFNTKLRKINYEFFVKFEKYSNQILQEGTLKEEEIRKSKLSSIEKGCNKLHETLQIINLKYFQSQQKQSSQFHFKNKKIKAFNNIKSVHIFCKKYSFVDKCMKKQIYLKFIAKFQQRNKTAIKIDLFADLLESIFRKKKQLYLSQFFQVYRCQYPNNIPLNRMGEILQLPNFLEKSRQSFFEPRVFQQDPLCHPFEMRISCPLGYYFTKAQPPRFSLQPHQHFEIIKEENIPLKLHNLKTHEEQINLNDCIDNGHLLMNQIRNNTSFRKQLDNLTISNINNKTSNTSVNSSLSGYDNLILPQSQEDKEEFISYGAITMRKQSSKPTQEIVQSLENPLVKQVKKSRKSLVITKRKESANDILSYGQTIVNSQKQKISFDPKKPKSTTTSNSKVTQKPSNADKQVIKRMLDELNKKFTCQDKIIKISLSNKKQTSNVKKEKSQSSGKNIQRKKIRSQFAPVTNFNEKISKKQSDKKSAQRQSYRIDLTERKQEQKKSFCQEKKKCKGKNSDNCFMSVTLNKTIISGQPSNLIQQKAIVVNQNNFIEQRTKQSHSQMSKKNGNVNCPSQNSQENQICKILSKYRSKKPSIPDCCMKIDLVTSKVNKVLSLGQNKGNQKNKIFFSSNESILDQKEDYKLRQQLNCSIGDTNLEISKSYSRPSDDTYLIKRNSVNHLSSQTDSVVGEYVSMLPSNLYFQQNQEENHFAQNDPSKSIAVNTSLDTSECFLTGSKPRFSNKPNSLNTSIDKKRASFERNLQEWDMMFQKQKSKFLKNDNKIKRKSTLNEDVISEIKNKIQQCLILGHKDTNAAKGPYLQLKKGNQQKGVLEQKKTLISTSNTIKLLNSSNSNKNSINKLYTTNKLSQKIEN